MGVVVQAESFSLEFSSLLLKEFDPAVFRYCDQPPSIDLSYKSGSRTVRTPSTLDYFVISKDFIGYEEWKPFKRFGEVAEKSPDRYCFNAEQNRFTSPALDRALSGTGLKYRLLTEHDINPLAVKNLDFIGGYVQNETTESALEHEEALLKLKSVIGKRKYIGLQDAIKLCGKSDILYRAVIFGDVYFPLKSQDLSDLANSKVFLSADVWSSYQLITPSEVTISPTQSNEAHSSQLLAASEAELLKAMKKLTLLAKLEEGLLSYGDIAQELHVSERSVRRWYDSIKHIHGRECRLCALLTNRSRQGNFQAKIPEIVIEKIQQIVQEEFLSKKAVIPHQLAIRVRHWCKGNGISPPSKPTVYRYINQIHDQEKLLRGQGRKAAYQSEVNLLSDVEVVDSKAKYYLHRCHIDHTELDVETVDEYGLPAGKLWLTYIVDEYSGQIVSLYISYRKPSYVTAMMALRQMIRVRTLRPESVVVDGGKEFQSTDFEILCAAYNISVLSREGQPRSGGEVERKFGSTNTQLIHNLDGNTKFMKDVRSISRTHNPRMSAKWTFRDLAILLNNYSEAHNEYSAKTGVMSPNNLASYSQNMLGNREYLKQTYNDNFHYLSLPSVPRKVATVRRGKPVVFDHCEYWHQAFTYASPKGTKVPVNWDPEDINHVYAYSMVHG